MSAKRIASRYAKSLIDLAEEKGQLEEVLKDIESFQKAAKNRDLYLLMKSPIINSSKKQQVFSAIFDGKLTELTSAFFKIILNKGREAHLPEIADEFVDQYKKLKQISSVKLITATPLTEETIAKIKEKLVGSEVTDAHVELETAVNPDLLGGFVLEFGDRLYDASVAHKLEQLKKEFTKNEYVKTL